ncbi:hypothetical protein B566_EDAN003064 [Ephemera danica]|nr:hypothetical protein B566_EDAN003064 [Ephemera danica]
MRWARSRLGVCGLTRWGSRDVGSCTDCSMLCGLRQCRCVVASHVCGLRCTYVVTKVLTQFVECPRLSVYDQICSTSHERKHRSSSSSSSRRGWSAEPRTRQPFVAASAHGEGEEREYPQHMVKFTKFRPSLSYCENPLTVLGYYTSRTDLFSSTSTPLVEIMQEFINSSTLAIEEPNSSGLAALQVSYDGDDASDDEPSSPKKPERLWYVKDDEINTLASLNLLGSPPKENAEPSGENCGEVAKSKWESDYESEHDGSQKSELAPVYEEFLNTLGLDLPGEEAAKQKRRRKVDTADSKKRGHEEIKESSEEPPAKKERSDKKKKKKKSKKKVEASSSEEEERPAKSHKKKAKKKLGKSKRGKSSDREVTKSKKKKQKSEDDLKKEMHKGDEDRKRRKRKKSSEKRKKKKKKRLQSPEEAGAEKSDEECREPTDVNSEDSSSSNAEEKREHSASLDASSNSSTFSTDFKPANPTAFSCIDGGSSPEQGTSTAELSHIAEVSIPLPPDTPPSKPVPAPSNIYSPSQVSSHEEDSDDATHNWDSSMSLPDTFSPAPNLYQIPMPVPPPNVSLPGVPVPNVPPPSVPPPSVPPPSVPVPNVPSPSIPVTHGLVPMSARLEFKPMSVKFKLKKVAIHPEFLEEGVDKGSVKQEGSTGDLKAAAAQDDLHPYLEGIVPLSALKIVTTEPSEHWPEQHSPKQDSSRWGPLAEVKSEIMAEILQTSPQPEMLVQVEEKVATSPNSMFMNPECKTPSPPAKPKQESSSESTPNKSQSPGKVDRRTPVPHASRSQESSEHRARGSDERKHQSSHSKRSESWKAKRGPSPDRLKPRRGRSTDKPRHSERLHSPPSRWSPSRGRSPRVKSPQASWSPRHRSPDRRDRPRSPEYQARERGRSPKFHSRSPTHRPCTTTPERHRFIRSPPRIISSGSPDRLRESSPRNLHMSSGFRHRSPHDRIHKRSPRRSPLHNMSPHRMSPLRNRSPRTGSPSFKRSPRGSPIHTRSPVAMRNRSPCGGRSRSPRGASLVRSWSPRAESPVRNRSPRGGSPVRNMSPPSSSPMRSRGSRGGLPPLRSRSPLPASRNRSPGDNVSSLRNRSPRRSLTPLWNRSPEFRPRTPPHRPRSPSQSLSPGRRHQSPRHESRWAKLRSPSPTEFSHSSGRRPRSPLSPCRGHRLPSHHSRRNHWSPSPMRRHRRTSGGYLEYEDKPAMSGEADMDLSSPASSPLVGLKRSVADSTISDSELASSKEEYYYEKQYQEHFYEGEEEEVRSPRRLSLDERIDLELGVKKEQPIPVYQQQQGYYPSQFQQYYGQEGEDGLQYFESQQHSSLIQVQTKAESNWDNPEDFIGSQKQQPTRVLQVGNVLQVVPSEDMTTAAQQPTLQPSTLPHPTSSQVLQECIVQIAVCFVQVGNIIQVVPVTQQQQQVISVPLPVPPAPRPPMPLAHICVEDVAEQRRLAKEKRRQEKDNRHKERTERRKNRIALRLKEVNQAWADVPSASHKNSIVLEGDMDAEELRLIQEAMSETPSEEKVLKPRVVSRPPKPVRRYASREPVLHVNLPSVEKGILVSPGFREKPLDAALSGGNAINKSVTFADGIRPGEGTSPSGGEDMPSPPPPPRKLPKEKRFTKTVSSVGEALSATKKHKRKKVKVKIVRQISAATPEEEEGDEEDMPPPPPPPGSPPPYLKQYYQQFQAAFIQPAPQNFTMYPLRCLELLIAHIP